MIRKLAALSIALVMGAAVLHAQDTIDPKTGKKRPSTIPGYEISRARERNRAAKVPTVTPSTIPAHEISRSRDRDREERERIARHERERRERIERERHERFERARDNQPPGWSKGKKTGWGDCDLPPGQAKKHGCDSHERSHHHHKGRG